MTETSETSVEAFRAIRDAGEDVALRRRVAAAIAEEPRTTNELGRVFPDRDANSIRPRVDELVRMRCVERRGTRTNPSGHEAYVHHITDRGRRYVRGEVDPDPEPRLTELKSTVLDVARKYLRGEVERDILELAVEQYDSEFRRRNPGEDPEGET